MTTHKPVALVSMPTLAAHIPSFQLALLKPTLERAGYSVEPLSLFLYFGRFIGWKLNDALAQVVPCLPGEWIWSRAAFGRLGNEKEYTKRFREQLASVAASAGEKPSSITRINERHAEAFLDWVMEAYDFSRYSVVGFTVVFQQLVASIALARRIKAKFPDVPIVFGGATFEDDLAEELLTQCPFIDAVHCGDADLTLPEVVKRLANRLPLDGVPGLMSRRDGKTVYGGRAPNLKELDRTPVPDFDEYFHTSEEAGFAAHDEGNELMLPIETARGCWYGMKNHCTFCGLNRAGMDFRSKSPEQVLEMLKVLSRRYGVRHFNAIDNILAPEYAQQLFGALAEGKTDLKLHYEIRPNLNRAQLRAMRLGGLNSVQPGVESFSTHVLTLMKKHTTGVRNLELLKWTTYYGIDNQYNVLHGFQGETAEDYALQAKVMRLIPHVQPPFGFGPARADRGSPMFERPGEHGVTHLRPASCYPYIFPQSFDLARIGYFFEDDRGGVPDPEAYEECYAIVAEWKRRWHSANRPTLTYLKTWDSVSVHDQRNGHPRAYRFDGRAAALYEACADARRLDDLVTAFDGDSAFVTGALADFAEKGLAVELDGKWLALALPQNPNH
ncbi:MAG: RiPP maturation radical SAM C-methyltransferase [Myxococcaceae bacterium]|nr:RiPP maturation radical SAM C-methyltransferase [Myxococcaceae bacterium]